MKKMRPLVTRQSPFDERIDVRGPVTWVRPKLVANVKFSEWTHEGRMRHPVYLGLREDKPARQVKREKTR
jgi:bifunctional non-homologous end joining protein LigD